MTFHALLFTWVRGFVALIGEDFCLTEAVNKVPLLSFCVLQDSVRPITGGEEDTTAYGKQIFCTHLPRLWKWTHELEKSCRLLMSRRFPPSTRFAESFEKGDPKNQSDLFFPFLVPFSSF
jgi:hypothetical protein